MSFSWGRGYLRSAWYLSSLSSLDLDVPWVHISVPLKLFKCKQRKEGRQARRQAGRKKGRNDKDMIKKKQNTNS